MCIKREAGCFKLNKIVFFMLWKSDDLKCMLKQDIFRGNIVLLMYTFHSQRVRYIER